MKPDPDGVHDEEHGDEAHGDEAAEQVQPDLFAPGSPRWREVPEEGLSHAERRARDAAPGDLDPQGAVDRGTDTPPITPPDADPIADVDP